MKHTEHKMLPQFEDGDFFDINDFNEAFGIIDAELYRCDLKDYDALYSPIEHRHTEYSSYTHNHHGYYSELNHTHENIVRTLSEAEYNALSSSDKSNGVIYFVY